MANCMAHDLPMPDEAPVIRMVLPRRRLEAARTDMVRAEEGGVSWWGG